MIYLIRRRKLGRGSCRGIVANSQTGIQVFRNDMKLPVGELVFRWGCTSDVPCDKVVNKAEAIHLVSNKAAFRKILDEHELCPKTWINNINGIVYPVVVRPEYHAQGRKLALCHNVDELRAVVARWGSWYAGAYIHKVSEYRVFVVQGRAVWVAQKTPANPQAIAWNVAQGGRFDNVRFGDWPLKAVKRSIEAFNLAGLDFGGVDVMLDAEGEVYVLEINAAPSQTSPYRQACTAKAFDWIVRNGKAPIPLIKEKGGYLKFVHPAIDPQAKIGG